MQTIQQFIEKHGLTMESMPTTHNEHIPDESGKPRMFHYHCNIHKAEKQDSAVGNGLALTFSVGTGVIESRTLDRTKSPTHATAELRRMRATYPKLSSYPSQKWPPVNMADHDRYWELMDKVAKAYRPDLASVLDCVASDCATYDNARSFEEWAPELGYDPDSRKAERIYRTIADQYRGLETLLGRKALQELMYDTERL